MAKSRILAILITVLICTVLGCGQKRPSYIVFPDQQIQEYINIARAGENDLETLYKQTVLNPVSEMLAALSMTEKGYLPPISNLDELEMSIKALNDEDAVDIIDSAMEKSNEYIQGKEVKVYLFPADPDDSFTKYSWNGVNGIPVAPLNFFLLEVNPGATNWKEMLQFRTAHEYYSVLEGFGEDSETLLDYLVDEGRPGAFAAMVYPEFESPWLLPEVNNTELRLIKDNLNNNDYENFKFKNYSYTIGCQIVQAFLEKNPDVSIEEWTTMSSEEILEKSEFEWEIDN